MVATAFSIHRFDSSAPGIGPANGTILSRYDCSSYEGRTNPPAPAHHALRAPSCDGGNLRR
ncbi:hypothetical protein GCM10027289_00700 [Tsukamurella serpentis]